MKLIDVDKLLIMTDSYKNELGRLKADPFVKYGIETVEGFINDLPEVKTIPLEKIKQAKEEIENISDTVHDGENHYYKDCKETKKECLSIIDKLIAESEEK